MNQTGPLVDLSENSLQKAANLVRQTRARRVFAVVDETAAEASGGEPVLRSALASCDITRFTGFELNPQLHDIERGLELFRNVQPDLVVALGGGTAMDLAKLINSIAGHSEPARAIITGNAPVSRSGKPLMAIPTTAGTGSEATQFAVAYVDKTKYSVAHESLLPTYAIIDPTLTYSLPPRITAATGLDAFCQAIESIWAVGATDESLGYATEAVQLALTHLVDAVRQPTPQSRLGMCRASHLAGKAINISKTTASHAISYAFTSQHRIPHGGAVALTLSRMLAFNAGVTSQDCLDSRGTAHVLSRIDVIVSLLDASGVPDACRRIDELITATGSACSPASAGITETDALERILDSVNPQRMSNNPRAADRADLMQLLTEPTMLEQAG